MLPVDKGKPQRQAFDLLVDAVGILFESLPVLVVARALFSLRIDHVFSPRAPRFVFKLFLGLIRLLGVPPDASLGQVH